MSRVLRSLLFSTLFPSASRPRHGIFVETRLKHLLTSGEVAGKVVAPVPWFPFRHETFGRYSQFARTPSADSRGGVDVYYPRYLQLPKMGMVPSPFLLALSALSVISRMRRAGFDVDLIDAHYFYPDGVAAVLLGQWLGRPVVVTARGSDLNIIARNHSIPRRMIKWAIRRAAANIAVSESLAGALSELGASSQKIHVVRNGVDANLFCPIERQAARINLSVSADILLVSVGNLVELKRQGLIIDAMAASNEILRRCKLAIIGSGPMLSELKSRAQRNGVADRVVFEEDLPQARLAQWYSAADLTILASHSEGLPNVVLESMACGTPVLGSNVGGIPEILSEPDVGRLVDIANSEALARELCAALETSWNRDAIREHALGMTWDSASRQQVSIFRSVVSDAN